MSFDVLLTGISGFRKFRSKNRIFFQPDAPVEDFLGVGVAGGRVKVVWHLGGDGVGQLQVEGK